MANHMKDLAESGVGGVLPMMLAAGRPRPRTAEDAPEAEPVRAPVRPVPEARPLVRGFGAVGVGDPEMDRRLGRRSSVLKGQY